MGCPSTREAASDKARICESVGPPAVNGTIIVIGLAGYVSARAAGVRLSVAAARAAGRNASSVRRRWRGWRGMAVSLVFGPGLLPGGSKSMGHGEADRFRSCHE
ncbi:hypothetical protein D3C81_719620 [compost metagenome]